MLATTCLIFLASFAYILSCGTKCLFCLKKRRMLKAENEPTPLEQNKDSSLENNLLVKIKTTVLLYKPQKSTNTIRLSSFST